jgi:molecular chaperone GrpE
LSRKTENMEGQEERQRSEQTGQDERQSEQPGQAGVAEMAGPESVALELNVQFEAKQRDLEEALQRYLRLAADFDNYRRRTRQEMEDIRKTAAEHLIGELLPVLDNFERALATARSIFPDNVVTGIDMIQRQLWHVLTQSGVELIEAAGKPFDPAVHEAFEQVVTDDAPEGTIVEEVQKGYLLSGKVLRPALVKVAKRPPLDEFAEV